MQISPGTRLGPYEILAPLGAGGMGEVYRARDSRLGREVAIKSLPQEFAQDAERLARFEREAKLLASLSHPNIAGIYGLEEVAGMRYLVLEFIEGETLAHRIARAPLPLDEALQVCQQVATAVEAAHDAGIVHRDLKPGNVILKPDGSAKVLDFGLAKAGAAAGSDPSLSRSPTVTHLATSAGVILGTAAYMSPEQARGKALDRRTDIWSFGCVLYECLTGRQLFEGETVSDVIAKILQTEPDWQALPAATPKSVRDLLHRCLTRDPTRRLRDIGEARIALEKASNPGAATRTEHAPMRPARRFPFAVQIAAIVITALVAVVVARFASRAPAPQAVALSVMLPRGERLDAGLENNVLAIAPDGRSLVYVAQREDTRRLLLRSLDRPEAEVMPGTANARNPFFSPDGEWVGFFAGRKLYKASVRGGTPIALADVAADRGGTWLDDGSIVYSPTFASPLYRIGADGGRPQAITSIDSIQHERTHRWPCPLPGGEWVVCTVGVLDSPGGYEDASIQAVSLKTGERRVLARGSCARYSPGDRLILARGGSLYSIPIDPEDPRGGATPVPVLDGVLGVSTSGIAFFDIARDGTLLMVPGRENPTEFRLAWMDLGGNSTPLPCEPHAYNQLVLSPDDTHALVQIGPGGGNDDIFLADLRRGTLNQITFDSHSGSPQWMPDGRRIIWSRTNPDGGGEEIVLRSLFGDEAPLVLAQSVLPLTITDILDDGGAVLFNEYGGVSSDILMVPTDGSGAVQTLIAEPLNQGSAVVSPDGNWVAYTSNETGMTEVCVRPMGRSAGRIQISANGGRQPEWSPDGHRLYYSAGGWIVETTVTVHLGTVLVESSRRLFELPRLGTDSSESGFDSNSSGDKFLVRIAAEEADEMREIAVRLNWAQSIAP
jgi:Tol biopolymer transport system component